MNEALNILSKLPSCRSFLSSPWRLTCSTHAAAAPALGLRSAEESISRDLDLRRSLRVQTAQAKLSAQISGVMPFALVFVISAVDQTVFVPVFLERAGVVLLCWRLRAWAACFGPANARCAGGGDLAR